MSNKPNYVDKAKEDRAKIKDYLSQQKNIKAQILEQKRNQIALDLQKKAE